MAELLYIESSPRKDRSSSIEVAHEFLDAYRKAHPQDQIETLDLWAENLPPFNGDAITGKYAILHGQPHTAEQLAGWKKIEEIIGRFKSADKYVISLPMWNFTIPYILKHYFDIIIQPGYTFSYSPQEGYKGLVTGKPILAIYARGGQYGAGSGGEAYDLQTKTLEQLLGFIGFTDIKKILVEPTMGAPAEKEKMMEKVKAEAVKMAANF